MQGGGTTAVSPGLPIDLGPAWRRALHLQLPDSAQGSMELIQAPRGFLAFEFAGAEFRSHLPALRFKFEPDRMHPRLAQRIEGEQNERHQ